MGHYLSEMGFYPSDYKIERDKRLDRMRKLLARLPMTRFSADFVYDICMVMSPHVEYDHYRDRPLDRLEAFLVADL